MIIDFSIENYLSIKERQSLSFEACKSSHLEDYFIIKRGKYRLLKLITLIGANASGKSNILKAFYLLRDLMLEPCNNKLSSIEYEPFLLDKKAQKNSFLSVRFIVQNKVYKYELIFDNKSIYAESLKCKDFTALREHTVYERNTDKNTLKSIIKYGRKYYLGTKNKIILKNLLHNRTLFGAYLHTNIDIVWIKEIIEYLNMYFMPLFKPTEQDLMAHISSNLKDYIENKDALVKLFKQVNFGINDIKIKTYTKEVETTTSYMQELLTTNIPVNQGFNNFKILLKHNNIDLDFSKESYGTQRFFVLAYLLLKLIKEGHFLAIDELERSLHPDLYQFFINSYLMYAKNSQLIITSNYHDFLHDRDLFRDDSVYIVQKSETGESELYSIADFDSETIRDTTSRYNVYRAGRLGGLPILGDFYSVLDKDQ